MHGRGLWVVEKVFLDGEMSRWSHSSLCAIVMGMGSVWLWCEPVERAVNVLWQSWKNRFSLCTRGLWFQMESVCTVCYCSGCGKWVIVVWAGGNACKWLSMSVEPVEGPVFHVRWRFVVGGRRFSMGGKGSRCSQSALCAIAVGVGSGSLWSELVEMAVNVSSTRGIIGFPCETPFSTHLHGFPHMEWLFHSWKWVKIKSIEVHHIHFSAGS